MYRTGPKMKNFKRKQTSLANYFFFADSGVRVVVVVMVGVGETRLDEEDELGGCGALPKILDRSAKFKRDTSSAGVCGFLSGRAIPTTGGGNAAAPED